MKYLKEMLRDNHGQDMVEYSLLLAFVCLTGAALYMGLGKTTKALWGITNDRFTCANQPKPAGCP